LRRCASHHNTVILSAAKNLRSKTKLPIRNRCGDASAQPQHDTGFYFVRIIQNGTVKTVPYDMQLSTDK